MHPHQSSSSDLWGNDLPSDQELQRLRELLLGNEIEALADLKARLDALGLSAEELAEKLPEAVALRTSQDNTLGQALAPTISHAFDEAVQRNPQKITDAIFPIIGPAIRKSIAETISGLVQTINQAFEHSLSPQGMKWRVESWRTGVPYGEVVIKHSLLYRVEHVFLVHNETGLLLNQVTAEGLEAPDADVISGMLTAIKDFVQDSFSAQKEGGLRRMTVADTTVYVQHGPNAMIAAAVRGHPPETFDERLTSIVERVHLHFRPALAEFDGDPAPLEPSSPILEEALETVTSSKTVGTLAPRLAWGVVVALLLLAGGLYVRGTMKWNAALTELEDTPGIVVVEANRGLRTWYLSGLADPHAPNPDVLLAGRRDTARFDATWEPYLSFHPAVVTTRAARVLAAPAGADLSMRGDTLVVDGHVTPAWLRQARQRMAAIPGAADIVAGDLRFDVPEPLKALQAGIQRRRIDFVVGSASLGPVARVELDTLAQMIGTLIAEATVQAFQVQLSVIGRADSTGLEETNRRLSEQRAATVRAYLESRNVPSEILAAQGIGEVNVASAPDETEAARRNRSATFAITLLARPESGPVPE